MGATLPKEGIVNIETSADAETVQDEKRLCEPLDEDETALLDEVAKSYFDQPSADWQSATGLATNTSPGHAQMQHLCKLDYCLRGVVKHADKIRKFKNLPDKVTLTEGQSAHLTVFFKLNKILDDLESLVQTIDNPS